MAGKTKSDCVDATVDALRTAKVDLDEKALMQPLSWRNPKRVLWNPHGDTFDANVPDEWIDKMFAVMALTPQHEHIVKTKHGARMQEYIKLDYGTALGTTFPRGFSRAAHAAWCCAGVIGIDAGNGEHYLSCLRNLGAFEPGGNPYPWPLPSVMLVVTP